MDISKRKISVCNDNKWAELSQDIIDLIAQQVTSIHNFLRFGAVCTSWRMSAVQSNFNPNAKDNQAPWIMLPPADANQSICRFFDPSTERIYHFNDLLAADNPLNHVEIVGSNYGWLATYDHLTKLVQLLNPVTRNKISLPRFPDEGFGVVEIVILSSNPSRGSCMALLHCRPFKQIITRVGVDAASCDNQWSRIEHPANTDHEYHFRKFSSYKHRLYGINSITEKIYFLEEGDRKSATPYKWKEICVMKRPSEISDSEDNCCFRRIDLVSGQEDLLVCIYSVDGLNLSTRWEVYKVEMKKNGSGREEEVAEMVKIEDLGDGAIFFSEKSSLFVSKLPSGCKYAANSIYIHRSNVSETPPNETKDYVLIWKTDMKKNTDQVFYDYETSSSGSNPDVWFVPTF